MSLLNKIFGLGLSILILFLSIAPVVYAEENQSQTVPSTEPITTVGEPAQPSAPESTTTPTSQPTTVPPSPTTTPTTVSTPDPAANPTPTDAPSPTAPTPILTADPTASPSGAITPTTPEPVGSPSPASPSPTPTPSPTTIVTAPGFLVGVPEVSVGATYSMGPGSVVTIKFNSISGTPGSLNVNVGTLSSSEATQLGALSNNVYDISSSMSNGTFSYDLTLPIPVGVNLGNFKVLYASSVSGLNQGSQVSQSITDNGNGTFTIHNLNHFTVFVVVNPNTQGNCDGVSIGTTPGTTCFSTVQEAVNAAANGDTINVAAGTYNETVTVNKSLTFNGTGNPTINTMNIAASPVTINGITVNNLNYVDSQAPVISGITLNNLTTGSSSLVRNGNSVKLTAVISDNNQALITVSMITADLSALGGGAAVHPISYDPATGIAIWDPVPVSGTTNGSLSVSVNASDAAGNNAIQQTGSTTADNLAPGQATNLSLTNPINNVNKTSVSITGNGEVGATINYTISNGVTNVSGTGTVSNAGNINILGIDVSSLGDGTLTLSVTLTDSAGNTSSATTTTSTKDTVAPTLTSTTVTSNNANGSFAKVGDTITLNFTSSEVVQTPTATIAGHATVVTNIGGNNWRATYIMVLGDSQGLVAYTIAFSDTVGNNGSTVNTNSGITFDSVAPTSGAIVVTSSNANGSYAKVGDTITVNFTSSETIQTPVITIAGHGATVTNQGGNNWRGTYVLVSGDSEGLVPYTISFTDLAGNSGTTVNTNSTITFDRTNPTLTSTTVSSSNGNPSYAKAGDTITINFTSSEGIQTPVVTIATHGATVTNQGGNNWRATYVMVSGDTQGLIPYTIDFQDLASNSGVTVNTNSSITFDSVTPTLSAITVTSSNANGSYAKVGDLISVNFTSSESIQAPTVTIAGHVLFTTNVGNNWGASYVMTGADTEGLIAYTISFIDIAGNNGVSVNANSAITFDRTAPTLTATAISSSNTNGSFAKVGDTITLTFTSSEAVQTPTVTIAGHSVVPTNIGNNWTASYVMTSGDTEGLIAYTIDFLDLASNSGVSVNTNSTITFDMTPPTLSGVNLVTSNPNPAYARVGDTVTLTFTSSETIQNPTVTINGLAPDSLTNVGNNWTAILTFVGGETEGLIAYTISFDDLAGNNGTTLNTNSTITLDETRPATPSVSMTTPVNLSNVTNVSIFVTGEAGTTVNYSITDGVNPAVTGTAVVGAGGLVFITGIDVTSLSDGPLGLLVTLTDSAGNVSLSGSSVATKDTVIPTLSNIVASSSNSNGSYAKVGDTITLTFASSEAIQTPTVTISGHNVVPTNIGNNWTATYVMLATDTEGLISYTIAYIDTSGNNGLSVNANSTITFDSTVPTLSGVNVATSNANSSFAKTGDIITLTFTSSETIQTPTVTIAGHNVVSTNVGNNWTATYVMTGADTEGLISYTIDFLDLASNPGVSVNTNSTITFDMTVPTVGSIIVASSNANPIFAKVGDTITLTFTSSEAVQTPVVTIAGHNVVPTNVGNVWTAAYVMIGTDTEGLIAYTIDFLDLASNPGISVNTNSGITFDITNPTISGVNVATSNANSSFARVGDTITVTFTSSEVLQAPVVTIAGHNTVLTNIGNNWTATYVMVSGDIEGLIAYTINFQDLASNPGISVNTNSSITFDKTNSVGAWVNPSPNSNVSGAVNLQITNSDNLSGVSSVTIQYKRNDGVDSFHSLATFPNPSSQVGLSWDTTTLALDLYTLRIVIVDAAGNSVNIDQIVGVATVISPPQTQAAQPTQNSMIITWTTDDLTTSRVIYDTVSHSVLGLAPNYGYGFSTDESDLSKVTSHSVTLTGLQAGVIYYYRMVSRGSPEAVSAEFSFKTKETGGPNGNPSSSAGSTSCDTAKPEAPTLLSAIANGLNQIVLTWTKAKGTVGYYLITYGLESGKQQFGNPNVGGPEVTSYTVSQLQAGVTYYFRVRAGNGCNSGDFSNEVSAKAKGKVLTPQVPGKSDLPPAQGFSEGVLGEQSSLEATSEATPSAPPAGGSGSEPSRFTPIPKTASKSLPLPILIALIVGGILFFIFKI